MKAKRTSTEEQLNYILECRQSGLTVYQWCQKRSITPTAYYNWIARLRKKGIMLPEAAENSVTPVPALNEVVPVDIVKDLPDSHLNEQQNTHKQISSCTLSQPTVEISIGTASIRFFSHIDSATIEATLKCFGGICYDR